MPDLYFYREPEDIEKEEQAAAAAAAKPEETYPTTTDWGSAPVEQTATITADWGEQPATTDVSVIKHISVHFVMCENYYMNYFQS